MNGFFARLIAFGLVVMLVLTAETLAVARGSAPAVGEIILCTGHGPTSVPVDSQGQPTSGHLCPDCMVFFAALSQNPTPLLRPAPTAEAAAFVARAMVRGAGFWPVRPARGPPIRV